MVARRETMSSVDHAWLRMDDPTNLMMINGVLTFSEPLSYDGLCQVVTERLLRFDRFQQRPVLATTRLGRSYWEADPDFDLTAHIKRAALPAPGGSEALQQFVSEMMSEPLDPSRPLWQLHLIEAYEGGSALLARLHHSLADGIALMRVLLSITDESADTRWNEAEEDQGELNGSLSQVLARTRRNLRRSTRLMQEGVGILLHPSHALELAQLGGKSLARLGQILVRWPDPPTVFKGQLGVPKRAAWSEPIPLEQVKEVGRVTGGTINDVLLAAVAGALRQYLYQRNQRVDGLSFHAVVPVNLRPLDGPIELGNKFGLVFLKLPVGIADEVERLEALRRHMNELKESPEAVAIFGLLSAVGLGPVEVENLLVNIFGSKATSIMTNVPGPRQQLYVAGSPLQDIMFWVPQSGRLGLGVSIISYNGRVLLGVASDEGLVPDPARIIEAFQQEFAEMFALVEMVRADEEATAQEEAEPLRRCSALTQTGHRCRNRAQPDSYFCQVHQQR